MSEQCQLIWIPDAEEVFVKGQLTSTKTIKNKQNKLEQVFKVKVKDSEREVLERLTCAVNPTTFDNIDDMSELTHLNEPSVLYNLENRFKDGLIYTYSGLFLVAMNPYSSMKIYTQEYVNLYHGSPKEDNKPHIFAVAEQAYRNLLTQKQDQSILVTGESGAGKTENTKKILQYLASITSDEKLLLKNSESFERKILQSNPILEAFGNAQTVRNNNSSRFGKFIKIEFDGSGKINGAHIEWYLLEKSRVIHQNSRERNYHVFYQLLAGMPREDLEELGLTSNSVSHYSYLRDSNPCIPGVDDAQDFRELLAAFDIVGLPQEGVKEILTCIATILHIGNVEFHSNKTEQASIKSDISPLSKLLGVEEAEFKAAVLKPRSKAGKEWVTQAKNATQSRFILNSLSKSLYEKLFAYIVQRINQNLDHGSTTENYIGLLDIAGFEIFKDNSFEQLCINYTNEKLQQFFNHHMFVLEQSEYLKENIQWEYIDFGKDLQFTVDFIEKKNPAGLLSILDEESILPQSTDESFYSKLISSWDGKSTKFKRSKLPKSFIVEHYAADVEYNVDGWLSKNKDPINDNLLRLLSNSSNRLISILYSEQARATFGRTAASRHKEQLSILLDVLSSTDPHFVRCIVPNTKKKAKKFDRRLILDQLRCNGVLEGIRIAREGYPNRIFFKEFYQRYKILAGNDKFSNSSKKNCEILLSHLNLDQKVYKIGNTKLFFKAGVLAELELEKEEKVAKIVTKFSAHVQGLLVRNSKRRELQKLQAAKVLSMTFNTYSRLMKDPWYNLYIKIKPLLGSSQFILKSKKIAEQMKLLQKDLDSAHDEMEQLQNKNIDVEKELSEVRTLLSSETEKLNNYQQLYDSAKKREEKLQLAFNQVEKLRDTLQSQNSLKQEAYEKLQSELEQLKVLKDENVAKLQQVEAEKTKLQNILDELKSQIEGSEHNLCKLKQEKLALEEELETLKNKLQSRENQVKELEAKENAANEELTIKVQQLEKGVGATNRRLEEVINENKNLKFEISRAKKEHQEALQNLASKNNELVRLAERYEAENAQIADLTKERDNLVADYESVTEDLKQARNELADVKKKYQELQILNSTVKETVLKPASTSPSSAENRVRGLEEELIKERAMNRFLNEKLSSGHHGSSVRDFQTKDQVTHEEFMANYEEMKLKLRKLSFRLDKEVEEKKELVSRLRFIEARLASASFDNQTICAQLKKLKDLVSKSNLNINMEKELEEVEVIEFNHEKLLLEVDYLKRQYENEKNLRINAEHVASSLHSKFRLIQRSDSVPDIYKLKYEASEEMLRALENKMMASPPRDKIGVAKGEIFLHRESFSKYEEELKLHKLENYKLQDYLKEANKKINALTHDIKLSKTTEAELKEQIAHLERDLNATEKQKQLLQSSVRHHQNQYENCMIDLHATETQMRDLVHSLKQSEEDIQTITDKIQELRSQNKQKEVFIWELQQTVSDLEGKLGERNLELQKLDSLYTALTEDLEHFKERAKVGEDKTKYLAKLDRLKTELGSSLRNETELKKEIANLMYQKDTLIAEADSKINNLLLQNSHYEKVVQDMGAQKELSEAAQKALQSKVESLEAVAKNLTDELNAMAKVTKQLETEREYLQSRLQDSSTDFKKSLSEWHTTVGELEQLKESLSLQQQQTERNEALVEKLQADVQLSKKKLNEEKEKNIDLFEENQALGKEKTELVQQITNLEQELADTTEKKAWLDKIHDLENKLKKESELRYEEMKKNQYLARTAEDLRNAAAESGNLLSETASGKEMVERQLEEFSVRVDDMEKYVSLQEVDIRKLEKEKIYYMDRVSELERELLLWQERYKGLSSHRRCMPQPTEEVFI
ncbi:HGL162Cp [Eremothecium sinecaudum]|uniref:HGL162Cp n=1 Tax=Eremothecium sinecaudum TaxID=45286 RepID=A0A0X8HVH8_9SACH|nr:HGL162Cp [Eremothecium sinecaudum]AMD22178.1 HGL162Cp [Eremothecium sinecaudum]